MDSSGETDRQRAAAARAVARDVLSRRSSGEALRDDDIIAAHAQLRPELERELRKLALVRRAMTARAGSSSTIALPSTAAPNRLAALPEIPGYTVAGELGSGGQGVVYEAIHTTTKRRVAIKLLRLDGRAARREAARFEREAQILAGLRHPNIVAIHETGWLGASPYYTMDYVDGLALDRFVGKDAAQSNRSARAVLRERVALLATVCEAVHAAHLKGVIHRDLKPANIRVSSQGQPMVLDFGLAKLADGELRAALDDHTMTQSGQFVGSLPWSSPEQVAGNVDELDLRTDVYALGVVAFQCLTGRFPYDVSGSLPDVMQRIRAAPPAALKGSAAPELRPAIDDDLETIIQTSLQKVPQRRYQSAGDLARDLRRWLAGEAIEAKRDSTWYVLRKTLRRHKGPVTAAAAFVLLLGAAAVGFALQAEQVREQRDDALAAKKEADEQRDAADNARDAEHRARLASQQVTEFLSNLLSSSDPFVEPQARADMPLRQAVDLAVERLEAELGDAPEVEAEIRLVLGRTYRELGLLDKADVHLQRALALRRDANDEQTEPLALALHELALLRQMQTQFAAARELCLESLTLRRQAEPPDDLAIASSESLMALLLRELGDLDQATAAAESALARREKALGQRHELVAESLSTLANVYGAAQRLQDAEPLLLRALALRRELLGPQHADVATTLANLGRLRLAQRRWADAEPPLREALDIYTARLGDSHPYLARAKSSLAGALAQLRRTDEAEQLLRSAIAIRRATGEGDDSDTAGFLQSLAIVLARTGRREEAIAALNESLAIRQRIFGDEHPATRKTLELLASLEPPPP